MTDEHSNLECVSDTQVRDRTFQYFPVVDEHSRQCLSVEVGHSIAAAQSIEVLERLNKERELFQVVITDSGSRFTGRAFDAWAYARRVQIKFIQPGNPV